MRDFVLRKANRAFLDIFWDINDPDSSKRVAAVTKLQNYLSVQRNDLQTYISYALNRLSKGLRSSQVSKDGCLSALISILRNNKNISKEVILTSFGNNVFSYKAHDVKEKLATNMARVTCLYVLTASGRLTELSSEDHKEIVASLKLVLNSEPCLPSMQYVLSQSIPLMNPKFVSLYCDLVSYLWDLAWQTKEPSAEDIIFILSLQNCPEAMKTTKNKHRFEVDDKSMVKRVVNAAMGSLSASKYDKAAELLAEFKASPVFDKLWARLSAPINKAESSISQKLQLLKMALILLSKLQTANQFRAILTPTFLNFLRRQLSSSRLSSHEEVCRLLNALILKLNIATSEEASVLNSNNDARFENAIEFTERASCLFTVIADQMPLFDASAASTAPHLLSSLLNSAFNGLSCDYLFNWARSLQKLFLSVEEDSHFGLTVDKQRLHILDLLRQIVFILNTRPPNSASLEFLCEALDFFLLIANSNAMPLEAAEVAVTPVVSGSALTQLGRCLTSLIRRASLKAEIQEDSQHTRLSKKALETLDYCMKHLIETDLKVCCEHLEAEASDEPLVNGLKVSEKMLLEDSSGSLGQWIGILHAATAIYAVTLHTNPSTPKETSLLDLLADVSEANRRRTQSSIAMETDSDDPKKIPEWSSVLTDAMLTLCVEPWRLLRDVISATFARMVARNELFIQDSFDVPLEVVFGLKKKDVPEGEEEEEQKLVSPLQLILSIADGKSKAAQERITVAGDEDDDDESIIDEDGGEHGHSHDSSDDNDSQEGDNEEETEEDIGGFAELSDVENLPEEAIDGGALAEEESTGSDEDEEFLTNEQMEQQDEALAALFRATRSSKMDAKMRRETVALLKLRSFDFLENLLLYSSDARLFLPTLYTVLQLAVTSSRKANRIQQRGSNDKGGYVPLARIVSTLENLRSRSLASIKTLYQSISHSDNSLLPICLRAIFTVFKNAIPDDKIMKCLQITCEFLQQFKRVDGQNCVEVLVSALEEVLVDFLSKTHPSRTHQQLLTLLIASSPDLAASTKNLILQRLKSSTSSSQSKSPSIYSGTALLFLANSVTSGLAKSSLSSDWTVELARVLIGSFVISSSSQNLMKSKAFSAAVFNSLFTCFKSNRKIFDQLTAEEIIAILTLDKSTVPKAARTNYYRLVQLIHSLRSSSENLSAVLDDLLTKKKQKKAEAKQARREKRKAKAKENAERMKKPRMEVDA
ncbi:hypothetical protein Aperf_G00000057555 [Anoplocephala perfoliata]